MQGALRLAVQDKRPIIPTLLPDCPKQPELPLFLGNRTWVDLRGGYTDVTIAKLVWGITGQKPDQLPETPQQTPITPAEFWPENPTAQGTGAIDCYRQLHAIYTRDEVPNSEARKVLWRAVKRYRPASFRDWQLANLVRWSAPEYLEVEERFTPLRVNVRVRDNAAGPAEKQQLPFDTLAEAMDAVFDEHLAPACVVCRRRDQGIARFPCASKITTWPRLGVAAQSVLMARKGPVCTRHAPSGLYQTRALPGFVPAAPAFSDLTLLFPDALT